MTHPAIAALLACPARPVPGVDLLARLYSEKPASIDDLLAVQNELQAAIEEADQLAYRSERAIDRCLKLRPIPTPKAPIGF